MYVSQRTGHVFRRQCVCTVIVCCGGAGGGCRSRGRLPSAQSLISVSPSRGCKPRTRISRSGGKVGRRMKIWNLFKWKQLLAKCRSSGFFVKCPAFNGFSRCCIQKIYHPVNRLRSFQSSCHWVTGSLGHSVTHSLGHSVTRSLGHSFGTHVLTD